jgi:hypothetical protein
VLLLTTTTPIRGRTVDDGKEKPAIVMFYNYTMGKSLSSPDPTKSFGSDRILIHNPALKTNKKQRKPKRLYFSGFWKPLQRKAWYRAGSMLEIQWNGSANQDT